jgi:glutathione S-transferase
MIELYYSWYSICSEKVLVALFEKGLRFTGHHIDLFEFAQTDPAYQAINPNGTVPTLVDDGHRIFESTIINEYLDEADPEPELSPTDPRSRAEMRYWVQRFQDLVFPAAGILSQVHFIADRLKQRWTQSELEALIQRKIGRDRIARQLRAVRQGFSADELAGAEERIATVLDAADETLADGRSWLAGDFSLADVAAAPNIYRFTIIDRNDLLEKRPRLREWSLRLLARPSVEETYEYAPSARETAA